MSRHTDILYTVISENPEFSVEQDDLSLLSFEPLCPDGSSRIFFRVMKDREALCLGVFPASDGEFEMREARAASTIGTHLGRQQVPVPRVYGYHKDSGLVLFEDLGNTRLYEQVKGHRSRKKEILGLYRKVVQQLFRMQFTGIDGFDPTWCCDTPEYDQKLMITRESQYFEKTLVNTFCGKRSPAGLIEEFQRLAKCAGDCTMVCFLHRDFQSRNIMVKDGVPFFIDFQGGRVGPPGYDLASLLLDPYINLSEDEQQKLYEYYLELLKAHPKGDVPGFERTFPFLAIQRNLQIAGAFAFLYSEKKKEFFKQFIVPALETLDKRLEQDCFDTFPILRKLAKTCLIDAKKSIIG